MARYKSVGIIGNGLSGNLAACVLAPFAESIVVFTPLDERANDSIRFRNQHSHFFLARGYRILRELFLKTQSAEQFEKLLADSGLSSIDAIADVAFELDGARIPTYRSDVVTLAGRWESFLRFVRAWALSFDNITYRYGHTVTKVEAVSKTKARIESRSQNASSQNPSDVAAMFSQDEFDLVIDASGLCDEVPKHLRSLEAADLKVDVSVVPSPVFYQSQRFELRDRLDTNVRVLTSASTKGSPYGFLVIFESPNSFIATYSDISPEPIAVDADLRAQLRKFPRRDLVRILEKSQPVGALATYRGKTSSRKIVLANESRVLMFGDSRANLNPLFGEGMTMLLEMAQALSGFAEQTEPTTVAALDDVLNKITDRWFQRSARLGKHAARHLRPRDVFLAKIQAGFVLQLARWLCPSRLKALWFKIHRLTPSKI